MENIDINQKIDNIILQCSNNPTIYSNIIKEFFTNGINKPSAILASLGLPFLNEEEIHNNFIKNKQKIIDYIKNQIKPEFDIYLVLSCIYGSFYGDAIGAFCEFYTSSPNNYKKIFKEIPVFGQLPGQITDDSEMAMSFAYAMMDNPEKEMIDQNYLYFFYGAWSKTKPIDIGNTTLNAFLKYNFNDFLPQNKNFQKIYNDILSINFNSLSNGFLMRKSTFIAWFYYRFYRLIDDAFKDSKIQNLLKLYIKLKELSKLDNQITHPNPNTNSISAIYCIMALGAIKKLGPKDIIDKINLLCKDKYFKNSEEDKYISGFIIFYIELFKSNKQNYWDIFASPKSKDNITKRIGWFGHALKLTLYYLINYEKIENNNRFRTIMEQICNLGGDTDTNCCIVGGVIGPLVGLGYKNFGVYFDKIIDIIPRNRYLFSICLMFLYVQYLHKSNRNNELIKDKYYFLRTILNLIYDNIEID